MNDFVSLTAITKERHNDLLQKAAMQRLVKASQGQQPSRWATAWVQLSNLLQKVM